MEKPEAIIEYNKYMGGVDHADQLLSYYGFPHRTVKWWRRAFFYLFDAAVVNSYIMYCQTINGRHLSHEQVHITIAKELLQAVIISVPPSQPPHGPHHQARQPLARVTERHFPGQLRKMEDGRQLQRNCAVCSQRNGRGRKTTTYQCKQCDMQCALSLALS